ncbi:hypothetical protein QVD17_13565 [Tagetes erecta]|uniref:Putative plant transposon protein domain-containing protein n=1 Tax=Tagetes erecta TaxID=13708 RepID=A0AAD8L2B6_TARER|nr:hypothetical protein QVD17_13565 [Tagetes erecta]
MAGNKGKSKAPLLKRKRGESSGTNADEVTVARVAKPVWTRKKQLSELAEEWRSDLYLEKIAKVGARENLIVGERKTVISDFQNYGLVDCFDKLGWRAALTFNNDDKEEVYLDEIIQWMTTLKKEDGSNPPFTTKLTGLVGKKKITLSFDELDKITNFDSGAVYPTREYEYLSAARVFCKEKGDDWLVMLRELFAVKKVTQNMQLIRADLKPLPKLLTNILNWNVIPRKGDKIKIRVYEVMVLYALITGKPTLSFRHLVLLNVWESREDKERKRIPHCRLLTRLFTDQRAISSSAKPYVVKQWPFCIARIDVDEWDFRKRRNSFVLTDVKGRRTYATTVPSADVREESDETEDGDSETNDHNDDENDTQDEEEAERVVEVSTSTRTEYITIPRPADFAHWSLYEKGTWEKSIHEYHKNRLWREEQEKLAAKERELQAKERELQAKEREEQARWRIEQAKLAAEGRKRLEDLVMANMYASEVNINDRFMYEENMRHYRDHFAGLPYVAQPTPVDWSSLPQHTTTDTWPHHPQSRPSRWIPLQPNITTPAEESSSQTQPNLHDAYSIYMRSYESICGSHVSSHFPG